MTRIGMRSKERDEYMESLEERVAAVEERNKRVEADKAWETSWMRGFLLVIFTYLAVGLYLWAIDVVRPWTNAIVPSAGFLLSTLTLPLFKKWWLKSFYKK